MRNPFRQTVCDLVATNDRGDSFPVQFNQAFSAVTGIKGFTAGNDDLSSAISHFPLIDTVDTNEIAQLSADQKAAGQSWHAHLVSLNALEIITRVLASAQVAHVYNSPSYPFQEPFFSLCCEAQRRALSFLAFRYTKESNVLLIHSEIPLWRIDAQTYLEPTTQEGINLHRALAKDTETVNAFWDVGFPSPWRIFSSEEEARVYVHDQNTNSSGSRHYIALTYPDGSCFVSTKEVGVPFPTYKRRKRLETIQWIACDSCLHHVERRLEENASLYVRDVLCRGNEFRNGFYVEESRITIDMKQKRLVESAPQLKR